MLLRCGWLGGQVVAVEHADTAGLVAYCQIVASLVELNGSDEVV